MDVEQAIQHPFYVIYASNEPKSVLARDLGVAKRQWRLFSNDKSCSWVFTQFNNLKMRDIVSI